MSRPAKKPKPEPGKLPTYIADLEELDRLAACVAELWTQAGCLKVTDLTKDQRGALAWEITGSAPLPVNAEKEKRDANARAAIKALLAWCRYDPNDNGLPHIVFRDARIIGLEAALLEAQPLADGQPARPWVNRGWAIWGCTGRILKAAGGTPSDSPSSYAVRFTALALQWAGYPSATPDAVSKELRSDPAFQERLLS